MKTVDYPKRIVDKLETVTNMHCFMFYSYFYHPDTLIVCNDLKYKDCFD